MEPILRKARGRSGFWLAVLACAAAPILIYGHSLSAPFIYDDYGDVVQNRDLRAPGQPPGGDRRVRLKARRPLTFLTLSWNYSVGRLNTTGYRALNLGLHILAVLLIFFLTRKTLLSAFGREDILISTLTALLFAVHPMNAEVVAYVSHRSDSLAAVFYLLSLLLFIEGAETREKAGYLLSAFSFVLALLSKEIAATLPALVLLYDYLFLSRGEWRGVGKRKYAHLALWAVLAAYLLGQRLYFGRLGDWTEGTFLRWTHLSYFMIQPSVILRYLGMLLAPVGQCIDHDVEPARTLLSFRLLFPLALLAALACAGFWLYRRKKLGLPTLAFFAASWFLITLSPTSSFLPIYDAMAERRVYLPGWGFALGMAVFYLALFRPHRSDPAAARRRNLLVLCASLQIGALSWAAWKRSGLYRDPLRLWQEAAALYPQNDRAYMCLAQSYLLEGRNGEAVAPLRKVIELNPNYAGAYNDLGFIQIKEGNFREAEELLEKAVRLDPGLAQARSNLARIQSLRKRD